MNSFADFVNISVSISSHATDLDIYLQSKVEKVIDPLKWWYNNRHMYPTIAGMCTLFPIMKYSLIPPLQSPWSSVTQGPFIGQI